MDAAQPANAVNISVVLAGLDPPGTDQYLVALGPGSQQFCGTPNGYCATQLPWAVVNDMIGSNAGKAQKVLWASFGSYPEQFFFTYQMTDGSVFHRRGKALSDELVYFIKSYRSKVPADLYARLRVQFGVAKSYIAWIGPVWISRDIPAILRSKLVDLSSMFDAEGGYTRGYLKNDCLIHVTWHDNGTYYIKFGEEHFWNFETPVPKHYWNVLLPNGAPDLAALKSVVISPHSPSGNSFAFFKEGRASGEPDFVLRFEPETVRARIGDTIVLHGRKSEAHQEHQSDSPAAETGSRDNINLVNAKKSENGPEYYLWAVSKLTGRAHKTDTWELPLKKNERIKVIKDMGNDWYMAENRDGVLGWVHGSMIDFGRDRMHMEPRTAYTHFVADVGKLLRAGGLRVFPNLSNYMNACTRDACQDKGEGPGICIHDLYTLLQGSGKYTLEFLKSERNKWHPDRFARYCDPAHRAGLVKKAQALFVLFGVLMERIEKEQQERHV